MWKDGCLGDAPWHFTKILPKIESNGDAPTFPPTPPILPNPTENAVFWRVVYFCVCVEEAGVFIKEFLYGFLLIIP